MTATPPLDGVRVLELTESIAGQAAGMLLADLGADVVRAVGPGGVERTGLPGWLCWNRGKRIVTPPRDAIGVDRLLERADILVVDGRPSELQERGLDSATVRMRAPALVHIWTPPVAAGGRWSELPHDQLLLDALSGYAAHHPATAERPVASVVATRPLLQGALAAVAAISGLIARERDGWGRAGIAAGLHAEAAALTTFVARSVDGPPIISAGKILPGSPSYRLYRCGDDRWLFLAALSPELFIKALDALDRLDILARDDVAGDYINIMRPDVGAAVNAELEATFATAPVSTWLERLSAVAVPAAAVGDPDEWLGGPVIAHASAPVTRRHPDIGEIVLPGSPFALEVDHERVGDAPVIDGFGPPDEVWAGAPRPVPEGSPPGDDDRPLAGLRVIDTATFLAGPFAGTLLAAHGADVVKVEPPAGDPYSVFNVPYAVIHEHKQRLTIDLADPAGRTQLLELAARADVVIDNLLSSSLARLDLGPDTFRAANDALVRCSITAYGAEGPYAELPGFDNIMQTLSGLVAVQGGKEHPVATTAPIHDLTTGCLGAVGTLAAVWARRRSGRGQRVFLSLAATSTYLQSAELTTYPGRPERATGGPDFAGPAWWHRFYRANDRWLAVAAATEDEQRTFREVVGVATDLDDEAAVAALETRIAERSCVEWVNALSDAGVPACPAVGRVELDDPFLVEQRYSHLVDTPHVGRLEVVGGYVDWGHLDRLPPLPVDQLQVELDDLMGRWPKPRTRAT